LKQKAVGGKINVRYYFFRDIDKNKRRYNSENEI